MSEKKHRVALIGCGAMGQIYADAYTTYPDTELVAIAEHDPDRRVQMGERFGVTALFADAEALFKQVVPDIAVTVLPVQYNKEAVLAAVDAGVKAIQTEKPIAASLADADAMVDACEANGVLFGGGNLQRAMNQVQEAAGWIKSGRFGDLIGASVHAWGNQVSGGGCQHISILRLFTGAEIEEVTGWGTPVEALASGSDTGLTLSTSFRLSNGMCCSGFGQATSTRGVDVWSDSALVRWDWGPPEIYQGFDAQGRRQKVEVEYAPYQWDQFDYLTGSIRSFIAAFESGSQMWISGNDLRLALEVAVASRESAVRGNVPLKLPLEDRSLAIYPSAYRWIGGDFATEEETHLEAEKRLA
jgi:predicted dehydrogenase